MLAVAACLVLVSMRLHRNVDPAARERRRAIRDQETLDLWRASGGWTEAVEGKSDAPRVLLSPPLTKRRDGGRLPEEVPVSEQSSNQWEADDAMAVQSGAVSEDAQPVTTPQDASMTAQGSLAGTAGPEGREQGDSLETEPVRDQ